jgi:hypothetical protein
MHGTRVNEVPIEKNEAVPLKNGDILQIGADIYRDTDAFLAPKFRFEAKAAPTATSRAASSSVFAVPDTETSDEEEDSSEDEPTLVKIGQVAGYGSQSNPVNVDDIEDSQSQAGVPVAENVVNLTATDNKVADCQMGSEEAPKNPTERRYPTLNDYGGFELDDLNSGYISDNAASHGSAPSPSYSNSSPIDSEEEFENYDDDEEEEEPLFPNEPLQETVSHPAKSEVMDIQEPRALANSSEVSDHEFSDDGFGYSSDEDSSPASSPVDFDALRRSKLTEMLNQDREKEFVKTTVSAHLPDPALENHKVSQTPTMAEVQAHQTQSSVPARASGMPMSLQNIMVNEKDVAPSSPDSLKVCTSHFTENARCLSKSPEPKVSKVPLKDPSMKPVDAGHGPMVEFYTHHHSWMAGPAPPRPTAPKPMPWISGSAEYEDNFLMRENEQWVDGGRSHPLGSYQDADYRHQEGWYSPFSRTMGDVAMQHVGRSGNFPDYVTNFANNGPVNAPFSTNVSPPCHPFALASAQPKGAPGNQNAGPAVMMPTPPAASPTSRSTDQPSREQHEPTKPRTKVSIPEILELAPRQSVPPTTVGSLKRKADVLDVEQLSEATSSSNIKIEDEAIPQEVVAPEQPPTKRLRLQFAATAVAGAMVGGLGVLGALISLPDSWLQ